MFPNVVLVGETEATACLRAGDCLLDAYHCWIHVAHVLEVRKYECLVDVETARAQAMRGARRSALRPSTPCEPTCKHDGRWHAPTRDDVLCILFPQPVEPARAIRHSVPARCGAAERPACRSARGRRGTGADFSSVLSWSPFQRNFSSSVIWITSGTCGAPPRMDEGGAAARSTAARAHATAGFERGGRAAIHETGRESPGTRLGGTW